MNWTKEFERAAAISDDVERAEALCDLAFDAECLVIEGHTAEAIELSLLLETLDPDDDLLHPAIEAAHENLVTLGVRLRPNLKEVDAKLRQQFSELDERSRLLAVATSMSRGYANKQPEAWSIAKALFDQASLLRALTDKEMRLYVEVCANANMSHS